MVDDVELQRVEQRPQLALGVVSSEPARIGKRSSKVVTQEVVAHSTKKIKIPNACLGVGVRYVIPFEILRAEGACFAIAS